MTLPGPTDDVLELLRKAGLGEDDLSEAVAAGPEAVIGLAVERLVVPGHQHLTRDEVAARAGMDVARATEFWRALGFVEAASDARVFTEVDVDMLRRVNRIIDDGTATPELALQMTRVMGQSLARIAGAAVDAVQSRTEAARRAGEAPESEAARALTDAVAGGLLEDLEAALGYTFRRHLADAAKRMALQTVADGGTATVVGFADLVGFTAISQQLEPEQLAEAVTRFESTAYLVVGSQGGRVVKMIGDEVMFAATSVDQAAEVALELVEAFGEERDLPDVRVGLAAGRAVSHQGDLFGPAPNLASRLVDAAYPGTVLVSQEVRDALRDDPRFRLKPVRPQPLKGFGRTRSFVLRRAPQEERASAPSNP